MNEDFKKMTALALSLSDNARNKMMAAITLAVEKDEQHAVEFTTFLGTKETNMSVVKNDNGEYVIVNEDTEDVMFRLEEVGMDMLISICVAIAE